MNGGVLVLAGTLFATVERASQDDSNTCATPGRVLDYYGKLLESLFDAMRNHLLCLAFTDNVLDLPPKCALLEDDAKIFTETLDSIN